MAETVLKFVLLARLLLAYTQAEYCTRPSGKTIYCCGYCSGLFNEQVCNDDGLIYTNSHYSCSTYSSTYYSYYSYWGGGTIAGVVIGNLIGLAILIAFFVCLCRMCQRRTQGQVVVRSGQTPGGITVVTSNTNTSSYQNMPNYPSPYQYNQQSPYPPGQPAPYPGSQQSPYPTGQQQPYSGGQQAPNPGQQAPYPGGQQAPYPTGQQTQSSPYFSPSNYEQNQPPPYEALGK